MLGAKLLYIANSLGFTAIPKNTPDPPTIASPSVPLDVYARPILAFTTADPPDNVSPLKEEAEPVSATAMLLPSYPGFFAVTTKVVEVAAAVQRAFAAVPVP